MTDTPADDERRGSILPANLSPGKRNALLLVVAALFLWFVWSIRAVVNPLLLGYLAAYILYPAVARLEKRGMSRKKAVNLIFLGGIVGSLLIGLLVLVQGKGLVENVIQDQDIRQGVTAAIDSRVEQLEELTGRDLPSLDLGELYAGAVELLGEGEVDGAAVGGEGGEAKVRELGERVAATVWANTKSIAGSVIGIGGLLFLVPLYAYYLLFHLGSISAGVRRYLPRRDKESISNIGRQIGQMLSAFFRGRLLVCLVKGLVISLGLLVVGVEYAFFFGMLSGALSLIPVFGPFLGFLFTALLSIPAFKVELETGVGYDVLGAFVRCAIVFGAAELLEGYVLMPKILGDSLRMNEVEVLFYLLAGGAALGMLGVLVALPIAAVVKILLKEVVLPALARFSEEGLST